MSEEKPAVIVDIDDCLVDFIPHWLEWIRKNYGVSARKEQITEWLLSECSPELAELGEDKICRAFNEPGFHLSAPPMPGALDVIRRLNRDHRIYFVTARHGVCGITETFEWFKQHLPQIQHKQLVFSRQKHIFQTDFAIDDKVDHLRGYRAASHLQRATVIGVEQPHNLKGRDAAHHWATPDAAGWAHIEEIIRGHR